MPLTYAVEALNGVLQSADITTHMWRDIWVVAGFIIGVLVLASLTLRLKTK